MTRSLDEIASDMLASGLTEQQVKLLAEMLACVSTLSTRKSTLSTGHVHSEVDNDPATRRRVWMREYKRRKRLEAKLRGKQTMSAQGNASTLRPLSVNSKSGQPACSTEVIVLNLGELQGSKEVVVAGRKKGSRLSRDWQLSPDDRQFARDRGCSNAQIDQLLAEFIDYWIAVPGQRGTKLDWSATWRNRIRDVAGRKGGYHGRSRSGSNASVADDLIARSEAGARTVDLEPGDYRDEWPESGQGAALKLAQR